MKKSLMTNDDFIDGFLTATTIITILLLLLFSIPVSAQLPETGSLGIKSDGVGTDRSISLAVDGNETGTKNLLDLCATAGVSPCSILSFRGWPTVEPPNPPINCVATNTHDGPLLTYDPPVDGPGVMAYFVQVFENSALTSSFYNGLSTSHLYLTGTKGRTYFFRVMACNDAGQGGTPENCSVFCQTNAITYETLPPSSPASVTATIAEPNINIAWSSVTAATNYRIEVSADGGAYNFLANDNASPYSHTTALVGVNYKYRVRAENAAGNSNYTESNTVQRIPPPPGVPRNFTSTKLEIHWGLSWLAPSSGGPVNIYRIQVDVDNSGTWFEARTTSELSTTYPALPGNSYKFRIRAENAGGVSDWVEHNAGPF